MGMLTEATVPTSHRWIPKAMNVSYEKAATSLRAQARLAPPDFASITDGMAIVMPVSVIDRSGTEVVHAVITCWVTPASIGDVPHEIVTARPRSQPTMHPSSSACSASCRTTDCASS